MANTQSVIEIVFNGIDNASQTARDIADAFGEFDSQVQGIAAPFADLADKLLATEAAALTAGAALVGAAINAADAFDVSFREIATLIELPIEELEGFRNKLLEYASTSTQSLDQITQATYNAISQGVAYTDSLEAVAVAERLAVAGKADLNLTLQGLLGTLNAYGQGMDSASEFSDIFFTTVKLGKTTIPELAGSIANVTGIAANSGVSFKELGAAIATLTVSGQGTSESITAIKAAISAILAPSEQAKDLAQELGIQFNQAGIKSLGFSGVLAQVAEKTGLSADQLKTLFGSTEAVNGVLVLAGTGAEKFKSNLEAMGKAAGATDAAFAKMKDATDTLAQAFQVALVGFGTPLLDSFSGVKDALASLAQGFIKAATEGEQGFKPFQDFINAALEGIAATIEKAAENLPAALDNVDWSGLLESLGELGKEVGNLFDALFGDIDITTTEGLTKAIQTVLNSFETLTVMVTGIISEFKPFAAAIGGVIQNFNDLDKASKLEFGQALGAMKLLVDVGTGVGLALIAIGRAGLDMGAALDVVFGAAKVGINALQVAFDTASLFIVEFAQNIVTALLKTAETLGADEIAGQLRQAQGELETYSNAVNENLLRNAQELKDGYNQATGEAASKTDAMRQRLDESSDALKNLGKAGKEGASGIQETTDAAAELGRLKIEPLEVFEALPDAADKAGQAFRQTGKDLTDFVQKTVTVRDANGEIVRTFEDQAIAGEKLSGTFSVVGKGATDAADKTQKAKDTLDALTQSGKLSVDQLLELTKISNDFKVAMEEIASNERIKNIEFAVSLKTAQLETDMERVKAAFASIDSTITSTGDLLGSLFGNLTSTDDRFKEMAIQEQIDLENKRRQEALDIQKQLAEAEIERIKAQTAALNRGDALITIEGDGLEPELEAFMWKILGKIRTRANAEFADYLLGLGVA
jgi:TP901 family phage tail tape measure protein